MNGATPAAVSILLEHIAYSHSSASASTPSRTLTFTLNDGDGTANGGQNIGTATATIMFQEANPQLAIDKTVVGITDEQGDGEGVVIDEVGDIINYQILLTNTGNVPLSGIEVSDPSVSDLIFVGGDTNDDGFLDLTETWTYSASNVVTQDEVDNRYSSDTVYEAKVLDSTFSAEVSLGIDSQGRLTNHFGQMVNTVAMSQDAVLNLVSSAFIVGGAVSTAESSDPDSVFVLHLTDEEVEAAIDWILQGEIGPSPLISLVTRETVGNVATADSDQTAPVGDGATVPITADAFSVGSTSLQSDYFMLP